MAAFRTLLPLLLATTLLAALLSSCTAEAEPQRVAVRLARATPVAQLDAAKALGYIERGGSFCSLSVIADEWVLLAAHCTVNTSTVVRIGRHDNIPGTMHRVVRVIKHPDFKQSTFSIINDVAVAKVSPAVRGNAALRLNSRATVPTPEGTVKGLGYGNTENGNGAFVLRKAKFVALSFTACVDKIREANLRRTASEVDKNGHLCANERRIGAGICRGDSGGPLVIAKAGQRFVQVGIISYFLGGSKCGNVVKPDVYARVSTYLAWIRKTIGNAAGFQPVA